MDGRLLCVYNQHKYLHCILLIMKLPNYVYSNIYGGDKVILSRTGGLATLQSYHISRFWEQGIQV